MRLKFNAAVVSSSLTPASNFKMASVRMRRTDRRSVGSEAGQGRQQASRFTSRMILFPMEPVKLGRDRKLAKRPAIDLFLARCATKSKQPTRRGRTMIYTTWEAGTRTQARLVTEKCYAAYCYEPRDQVKILDAITNFGV